MVSYPQRTTWDLPLKQWIKRAFSKSQQLIASPHLWHLSVVSESVKKSHRQKSDATVLYNKGGTKEKGQSPAFPVLLSYVLTKLWYASILTLGSTEGPLIPVALPLKYCALTVLVSHWVWQHPVQQLLWNGHPSNLRGVLIRPYSDRHHYCVVYYILFHIFVCLFLLFGLSLKHLMHWTMWSAILFSVGATVHHHSFHEDDFIFLISFENDCSFHSFTVLFCQLHVTWCLYYLVLEVVKVLFIFTGNFCVPVLKHMPSQAHKSEGWCRQSSIWVSNWFIKPQQDWCLQKLYKHSSA